MADSSDDDVVTSKGKASKQRAHARWEATASRTWDLGEAADGNIEGVLGGIEEANKRRR
jgi:transcription initiation factor TFIIH subunit 2